MTEKLKKLPSELPGAISMTFLKQKTKARDAATAIISSTHKDTSLVLKPTMALETVIISFFINRNNETISYFFRVLN